MEIVGLTKCGKAADDWRLYHRGQQREPDGTGSASLTRSKHETINGLFRLCGVERLRHRGWNDFGNGAGFAEGGRLDAQEIICFWLCEILKSGNLHADELSCSNTSD